MYKEQLMHYGETNEYVKPADGADTTAIGRAEKEIGCTFPDDLQMLLSKINGDGYLFFGRDNRNEHPHTHHNGRML